MASVAENGTESHRWRRLAATVTSLPFRVLVTAVLLAVIAVSIDWGQVADRLESGSWEWFAGAVGVLMVATIVGGIRWHFLLVAAGLPVSRVEAVRAYWIAVFANNFLPTGFGGDAARTLIVARGGPALSRTITSVIVDRISSIGCLILVGLLVLAISSAPVPGELVALLAAVAAGAVVGVIVIALLLRARRLARFIPDRVKPWAREMRATLLRYERDIRLIALVLGFGIAFQVLVVLAGWMMARSIDLDISYTLMSVVLPLVLVVTLFPVSIAGFGVREGGFVVLLATAGISSADATLFSLLTYAGLALSSTPGGLAMLTRGERRSVLEHES